MTRALPAIAALAVLLSACVEAPRKPLPPAPPPPPAPAVAEEPATEPDWRDRPLTPGAWSYARTTAGSEARFGPAGAPPALTLRCDRAARAVRIALAGTGAGPVTVTTSYSGRDWPVATDGAGQMVVTIPAADPFLDRIAFSRGRVSYALPGQPLLMVPAWAEPARVIEDCRG